MCLEGGLRRSTLGRVRSTGAFPRTPRPEGPEKVSGRALYVADLEVPGAWVGGVLRSPVAAGRSRGIERDPRFPWSEVVLRTARDLPGENVVAMIADDQPLLAGERIAHVGEPIALVAAPDRDRLRRALEALRPMVVEEEPLFDFERSERVLERIAIEKGDARAALAAAEIVIEGTYRSGSQEQMYIEPQGCIAWPAEADGTVRVVGSLQCPFYVQRALARALGIEAAKARVVQAATGGGFGGKEDYPSVLACQAAVLAQAACAPVRMILDRHEDLAVTPKRHPARVRHRTAVDRAGRLVAMEIEVLLDGGAYTTLSPVVLSRACIHAAGPYRCEHVAIEGRAVATNHVPYGAFRGFGVPQVCFALERHMDRIARELGLHPAELRLRNALRPGDTTATGQRIDASSRPIEVLERALERSGFARHAFGAPKAGRVRRGLGLSFFFHGSGFTGSGEAKLASRVAVELRRDGGVLVQSAATEFGQGTLAMLRALALEALGCAEEELELAPPDTALVPNSGPTVASRTCMVVGGLVTRACRELAARIEAAVPPGGTFRERALAFLHGGGAGRVELQHEPPPGLRWDEATHTGDAYPAYAFAADVAEVQVDLDTFEVRAERLLSVADVGRAIEPALVEGQLEGGGLQAIGFGHLEVVTTEAGRFVQDRMATCIVPTAMDAPRFEVELVDAGGGAGSRPAKGVGELPMDGGAPALCAAIEDALGIALDRVPATPELLLERWIAAHPEEGP